MSTGARKSKSLWDMKEDTHSSSHHFPRSDLEANNASSKDRSRWPSSEHTQEISNMKKDNDGDEGWGGQSYSRSPDNFRSVSRRGRDRVRSRSRSRSRSWGRDGGWSRSRSRSRSRSSSRSRGRFRERGRSRSGSPFRDHRLDSSGRIDRRSRPGMPPEPCRNFAVGNCRRGSQCRFVHQDNLNYRDGGRSENDEERRRSRTEHGVTKYGDIRGPEDYPRNKVSSGYEKYYGEGERLRSSSKDARCCNDFLKGRCNRGASCRYPHHGASGDSYERGQRNSSYDYDSKRQPNRIEKLPCKYYVMGNCHRGNGCRFSHDGPSGNLEGRSLDGGCSPNFKDNSKSWNGPAQDASGFSNDPKATSWGDHSTGNLNIHKPAATEKQNSWGLNVGENNKSWNGPTWDDPTDLSNNAATGSRDGALDNLNLHYPVKAEKSNDNALAHNLDDMNKSWNGPWGNADFSDNAKAPGWGASSVGNLNFHDPTVAEKQTDDKWGQSLENESRMMGSSGFKDEVLEKDEYLPIHQKSSTNGAEADTSEFVDMKKLIDTEEPSHISQGSQNLDGISMHVYEQSTMQEVSGGQLATNVTSAKVFGNSFYQQHHGQGVDNIVARDGSNAFNEAKFSGDVRGPVFMSGQIFGQNDDNIVSQPPSSLSETYQTHHMHSLNPSNRHNNDLNGSVQQMFSPLDQQNQTHNHHKEAVVAPDTLKFCVPQVPHTTSQNVATSEQVAQITNLPATLTQISWSGPQMPQLYAALGLPGATELAQSLPRAASVTPDMDQMGVHSNPAMRSQEQADPVEASKPGNFTRHPGFSAISIEQENQNPLERSSSQSIGDHQFNMLCEGLPANPHREGPYLTKQENVTNLQVKRETETIDEKFKQEQGNIQSGGVQAQGKVKESNDCNAEKESRLFKIALVEFTKNILKPTWKEGQMSREVHKTIVKKVVDKVTSTIQGDQIPKTQDKIDQYLSFSKPKITKLVEAYVERFQKS